MTEIVDKWERPSIMDVDNKGFIVIREQLWQLIHEVHMAENHKIINPDDAYNVYWQNFCDMVEHLTDSVDSAASNIRQDS